MLLYNTLMTTQRPTPEEYFAYYGRYISLVPEGDVVEILAGQINETLALLAPLTEAQASFRYAAGKWSVKQVVGHMIDVERIFAFRALAISRGEQQPLPGFEQDDYVNQADFDHRALADLLDEFTHLRHANVLMFRAMPPEAWGRVGVASGNKISVRALAYIMAGHELYHRAILAERYLAV